MIDNKIVFITGGAGGIGFEIGKEFAENGAKVIISDISQTSVNDASARLRHQNIEVTGLACDVTNEQQIKEVFNDVINKFGRIDVLINNAGLQHIAPIEEFPTEKFELLLKVMLVGSFLTTKYVFPIMKDQRYGRIINMSSINGLIGFAGKAAYNSAKHGIIGLTKVAALEGAEYGITVNAICPGYVDTLLVRNQLAALAKTRNISPENVLEELIYPLVPQKRLLSVNEISSYVVFLASDRACGITGQAIVIDGGYTAQ